MTVNINGKEIQFSISNKTHAKRFEAALHEMEECEKRISKLDQSDLCGVIDAVISMFRDFFLTATGADIIGDCEDMEEAKEFYFEFLSAVNKQKKAFLKPFSLERIK